MLPLRRQAGALAALAVLLLAATSGASARPSPLRPESGSIIGVLDSLNASILTLVAIPDQTGKAPGQKRRRYIGSGIATGDRQIVTTASLAMPHGTVHVLLGKGQERTARLKGVDRQSNLAVFEVDQPILRTLRRAPPQSLAVGTWVAVLSNVAITRPQAALGRVVGRGERVDFAYSGDVLEIDAPSYLGATGGAVVNENGEWVAVVVGRATPAPGAPTQKPPVAGSAEPLPTPNSVLIALPVDQVERIAGDLAAYGSVRRGFLGIRLRRGPPTPGDTLGVPVDGVIPGSPAAAAGIRRGDRILACEAQEVRTPDDLTFLVQAMRPGDEAHLTILRDTDILPIRVVLGSTTEGPAAAAAPDHDAEARKLRETLSRLREETKSTQEKLKALEETPPPPPPDSSAR
ncbi:MAG: S1C family serine protease [Hyphomicrobiales bacterium]